MWVHYELADWDRLVGRRTAAGAIDTGSES
jgi:hypothetical protein